MGYHGGLWAIDALFFLVQVVIGGWAISRGQSVGWIVVFVLYVLFGGGLMELTRRGYHPFIHHTVVLAGNIVLLIISLWQATAWIGVGWIVVWIVAYFKLGQASSDQKDSAGYVAV